MDTQEREILEDDDPTIVLLRLLKKALDLKLLLPSHVMFQSLLYFLGGIFSYSLRSEWLNSLLQFGLLIENKFGSSCIQLLRGKPGNVKSTNLGFFSTSTHKRHRSAATTFYGIQLPSLLNFIDSEHDVTINQNGTQIIPSTFLFDGISIQEKVCVDQSSGHIVGFVGTLLNKKHIEMGTNNSKLISEVITMGLCGVSKAPKFSIVGIHAIGTGSKPKLDYFITDNQWLFSLLEIYL
jgi:hypothetical protein